MSLNILSASDVKIKGVNEFAIAKFRYRLLSAVHAFRNVIELQDTMLFPAVRLKKNTRDPEYPDAHFVIPQVLPLF